MEKSEVEEFYDNLSNSYRNTHSNRFVDEIFEHLLHEYLPKGKLILLDAGAGIGRFSIPLAYRCKKLVLTEISEGMLNEARKNVALINNQNNIEFYHESATNMKNQASNSFDVVLLMNSVLDYCDDYIKSLHEVHRVLKKGGLVIGTVNNRLIYTTTNILLEQKSIKSFLKAFATGDYCKWFLVHDFTYEELKNALEKTHFKTTEIFGPTNLLRKWEYESLSKNVNRQALLRMQLKFAKRKEYLNNSSDFFFVAKKI